ncbi:MAG: preprotein translocase subunit SecG [bacterium]|nr:preprotein translocase subunit SecG [bacterium]
MELIDYIILGSTVLMTFLILIQTRGASLGAGLGGASGEINTVRRGSDKTIFQITILLGFIFSASLLLKVVII